MNARTLVITAVAAVAMTAPVAAQDSASADRSARTEFIQRLDAYVALKEAARQTVLPLVTLSDVAEIQRRTQALATVIRSARSQARQGDIFTPEMAQVVRRAIREGCEGDYLGLVALIREEAATVPAPGIHDRWPPALPVPTMLPQILAALPPLPAGLQYRFMNTALVLVDIDANLIIDFVADAIPITTENDAE